MKRMLKTAAALLLGAGMLVTGALAAAPSFTDVPSGHWAYSYVTEAAEKGLVSGKGGGLYGVNDALNTGEFATMICGLLYPEADDPYAGQSSYWWYQYAEAAYQRGDLDGTVAGERRRTDGAWTATVVQQSMSRYDLAQIISNIMESQGWAEPDPTLVLVAMATIPDWSSIPENYQAAVALAYAGGFLSGMDGNRFNGDSSMTRGQAAVVLCALLEAKTERDAPTYTNRPGELVNGEDATEENVMDAISELKKEFYAYSIYDLDRTYTSQRLGSASGEKGFAYMLSDRVFGALTVSEQDDPDRLKPGDLLELDGEYQLVSEVNGNVYHYVTCDGMGIVYWRSDGKLSDIDTRYDTIWTRYEGEGDYELDENRASDLIDRFLDEEFDYGDYCDYCDDGYKSSVLSNNSRVYDDEAFAYLLSDYIFGDLDAEWLDGDEMDLEDIRPGDIIELDGDYYVVTGITTRNEKISVLSVNSDYEVYSTSLFFDDLDKNDAICTRYEDGTVSRGDQDEDEVIDLLDRFLDREYDVGDWCDICDDGYKSPVLSDNDRVYDCKAFAYYLSDYLFDDADYDEIDVEDVRVGDILYLDESGKDGEDIYCVVSSVSSSKFSFLYAEYDKSDKSYYVAEDDRRFDDLNRGAAAYTRYEGGTGSRSDLDEDDVEALIDDFLSDTRDGYKKGEVCDECADGYESPKFGNKEYFDSQAFAFYMSDYIFGKNQPVDVMDGDEVDIDDIRLGDVILYYDHYYVVIDINTRSEEIDCLTTDSKDKVVADTLDLRDLIQEDKLYTRY